MHARSLHCKLVPKSLREAVLKTKRLWCKYIFFYRTPIHLGAFRAQSRVISDLPKQFRIR